MKVISINDERYPELLKKIHYPPPYLYMRGDIDLLKYRCITIVGTRKPSEYGEYVVNTLLDNDLASLNICVVSGLALGIDSLVHKRCLKLNIPTIAVIAGGIDNIYPRSNSSLYDEISRKNGIVIAEHSGRVKLKREYFPIRNRILAGLSFATLIVESDVKGGSQITAKFALDEGRDVLTIPGDIRRITSHGCNMLIKQGATPISSAEDLKESLGLIQGQLKLST
jgi:DNA processing protein